MPWLTLIYSQFIYLIVLVLLLRESSPQLRRLLWERWLQVSASGYHRVIDIDVGFVRLHGGSSDSNGGESSLTRWEEKGRLSGSRHQGRVIVAKKRQVFKAGRDPAKMR